MKFIDDENMLKFEKCIDFLNDIGIPILFRSIGQDSFLPGFLIENGILIIDKEMLKHPGDILHEAGHIATVPSADRSSLTEKSIIKRKNREAEEMMAIAWSYAACMHLMIDPAFVFHDDGYRGGSGYITDSCSKHEYIGMSMLQSVGMTTDGKKTSSELTFHPYVIKWLRD